MKIAIVSGKGGTGKSSISASLVALSSKVVAVDCDVDASNLPILIQHKIENSESFVSGYHINIDSSLCTLCKSCAEHCSFQAIHMTSKGIELNNILCEGCGLCEYLCPTNAITIQEKANSQIYKSSIVNGKLIYGRLFPGDNNSGKMIAHLRIIADKEMAKEKIKFQILDGPPGIGCPVLSTITGIDKLIILSEPTQSGLSDLKRIYQTAISFCKNIYIIINKCDINEQEYKAIHYLCGCLKLPILAELPFDRKVVEAQVKNETIMTYAPDSIIAIELKKVFKHIIKN